MVGFMAKGRPAEVVEDEDARAARLLDAQAKAVELFAAIEPRGIIVPGAREVEASKPIAFICHAGWVPISARILKGRRATSVGAIRDDMVNAGADWVDEATVVDGNLISARTPADLGPWMKALLKAIELKAPAIG